MTARARPGHAYFAGAPLLIAHRGGAALAPENTMPAFQRAIEWWRADVLEIDVQPTRDGEAVVIHDSTVDRTTDGAGPVARQSLAELKRLDAGYHFTADGGHTFPFRGTGVRIPTLDEVLRAFPAARINVEIKDGRAQRRVWETIHEAGAAHRVLVAAERRANRSRFRLYAGPTSASAGELYAFFVLLRLRMSALFLAATDAFQMPERHKGRQVLSPRWIQRAHARNIPVHVWTVNERADMLRLLGWGVDGIVSDRPDLLAAVLHQKLGRPRAPGPPADIPER